MASVYLTKKAFESMEDSSLEYNILSKQTKVYVDMTDDQLDKLLIPDDESLGYGTNPFFDFQEEHVNVTFSAAKEIFDQIKNGNYSAIGKIPDGIFVLDVDEKTAENIKNSFGVLCMSEDNMDFSILTRRHTEFCEREIKDNAVEYDLATKPRHLTFADLIPEDMILPCNSIVVIDKYLFDDDKEGKCLIGILSRLLGKKLQRSYCHLLIIFDNAKVGTSEENRKEAFRNIVTGLQPIIEKINDLRIKVEFLAGDFNPPKMFEDMHNRKIVTNYSIITAEHGFGMYDNKDHMKWDQKFTIESLYSDGINTTSITPEKERQIIMKKVCSIVRYAREKFDKNNPRPQFRFGQDAKANPTKISPKDLVNRLERFYE
jgi:hypothetical protein